MNANRSRLRSASVGLFVADLGIQFCSIRGSSADGYHLQR
jgi:hypothetical protein